ncbi:MAG: hypothetical protein HRT74_06510, partial [Flavobacteriales bacterium]|nr:hypothetical protein [Flavobacteriales bacterium]
MAEQKVNTNFVEKILDWASDLGCDYAPDRVLQNQTRLTNRLAWVTCLSGVGIATYLISTPTPTFGVFYIYFISVLMLVPVALNATNRLSIARIVYILIAKAIIFSLSLLFGKEAHFQYFFITAVGMPFVFFSNSKVSMMWALSLAAVANWVAVEILFGYTTPYVYLGPELAELFRWLSNGLQFILIGFMFYFFSSESTRFVQDLRAQQDELQESNDQLDIALEQAKEASKAKTMFLANMTHEIRTPLNGIIVASELLKEVDLCENGKGFSDIIHTSSTSLLSIVNDVLDLSKGEANKIELVNKPFSLHHLVKEVLGSFWIAAKDKEIALLSNLHPDLKKEYTGDEQRIRQVLNNLIGNAVKFCDSGYVMLRITPDSVASDGLSMIKFSVEDSGIGVDVKKQEAIF